jgi:hypothetical protein
MAEKDLNEMRKESEGQDDHYVQQALETIRTGQMKKLVEKVKSTRVIGIPILIICSCLTFV